MSDIVEKVARAMALVEFPDLSSMSDADEYETVLLYAEEAQAALDAIRQEYAVVPREADHDITGAVVKPGEDRTWAVNAYRAMIAAGEVR